jgi:SAM-dependent methyltransferase
MSSGIVPLLARRPENVIETIAERDEMLEGDPSNYFHNGLTALRSIRIALALAGVEEVRAILDFPCGYGRVLRMLDAEFPGAEIVACDLDRDAVDFCRETFGSHDIYATPDPRDISMDGDFDLIWCGSLLTHMAAEKWPAFLGFFASQLAAGGVLVFTTHGRRVAELLQAGFVHRDDPDERRPPYNMLPGEVLQLLEGFRETGFAYQKYPLHEAYGFSLSRPDWVVQRILGHPSLRLVLLTEAGWAGQQDVVACVSAGG